MTDALRIITENTAKFGGGTAIQARWADLIDRRSAPEDDRTAEEIIADVAERAGITIT